MKSVLKAGLTIYGSLLLRRPKSVRRPYSLVSVLSGLILGKYMSFPNGQTKLSTLSGCPY